MANPLLWGWGKSGLKKVLILETSLAGHTGGAIECYVLLFHLRLCMHSHQQQNVGTSTNKQARISAVGRVYDLPSACHVFGYGIFACKQHVDAKKTQ